MSALRERVVCIWSWNSGSDNYVKIFRTHVYAVALTSYLVGVFAKSSSTTSTRASRIRRPNASGGLPRILTQIKLGVQSKQWQERDTALARLHNEVLRKTQYAPAHTSTIVRELLLPACGDANGKVQVNALAATVECIERYYESIDARTCATMIQTLGGLLASNNTMTFTATAAALDRMIVHCVKPYLIKPWCLLINSEKSLKVCTVVARG